MLNNHSKTKLESSGLTLFESIEVVNKTRKTLKITSGKLRKEDAVEL